MAPRMLHSLGVVLPSLISLLMLRGVDISACGSHSSCGAGAFCDTQPVCWTCASLLRPC